MQEPLPNDPKQLIEKRKSLLRIAAIFLNSQNFEALTNVYAQLAEISRRLGDDNKAQMYHQMKLKHEDIIMQLDSQISLRKKEQGQALNSGIIPTVIKKDREVLDEIIVERLPYLLNREKNAIIDKLVRIVPGPERDELLKAFLTKYKKYSELDIEIIKDKLQETKEWFIDNSRNDLKGTHGLFDPFQIIDTLNIEDIKYLVRKLSKSTQSELKEDLLFKIFKAVQNYFYSSYDFQKNYGYPINFLGYVLFYDPILLKYFEKFDFISIHEMMAIFADFCADTEINVYDSRIKNQFPWDLSLLEKDTGKTGVTFFLRGHEILDKYAKLILQIKSATEYCDWIYVVTTPLGAIKIGLDKLIEDMENYKAWLYIIDPSHAIIYALLKGTDTSNKRKEKENELKNTLKSPLRGIDPHIQFSQYIFDKKFQYKSKSYMLFGKNEYPYKKLELLHMQQDINNLQYLIIFHKKRGTTLEAIRWTSQTIDPDLISGLISAIDSFGSSLSDSTGLEEISYKGFFISFVESDFIKACLLLNESPSPRLKELFIFAINKWESMFKDILENFSGDIKPFKQKQAKTIEIFNQIFLNKS
ncbi:MAG: hypothetical protein ACFFD2_17325 [Promethearchaeota archaeon]